LHDADAVTDMLERAGWADVATEPHSLPLPFGGGISAAAAANTALDFGPTRVVLTGMDDATVRAAEDAIRDALSAHLDGDGHVVLSGSINVVTAVRR
jgi:hypothetical protein